MRTLSVMAVLVGLVAGSASATPQIVSVWSSDTVEVFPTIFPIGGSGQVNGNFTVAEAEGVQIGLRANRRFSGDPLHVEGSTYFIETGESGPGLTLWNYDIHIDFGSQFSMGDYLVMLIASMPNHSTFDLQQDIRATAEAALGYPLQPGYLDGVQLFQTSQNPGFFASGIDPDAHGLYTFDLHLFPHADAPFLSTTITVAVDARPVPEPATMLAATMGLIGLGGYVRRRVKA